MHAKRHFASEAAALASLTRPSTKKFPLKASPKQLSLSATNKHSLPVASIDDNQSPISTVSLVIQSGPRYQQGQRELGAAQWMKQMAFKSTNTASHIKRTAEAEILGQALSATLTREQLVLSIDCQRTDVSDAVGTLADIVDGFTRRDTEPWGIYTREYVRKSKQWTDAIQKVTSEAELAHGLDASTLVMDNLHFVAFRQGGLGMPLYPQQVGHLSVESALAYAVKQIQPTNMSLVGYGVKDSDLSDAFNHYWGDLSLKASGSSSKTASKYTGGESIDPAACRNVHYALAFNGASLTHTDYYTAAVLKQLLGGNDLPSIKYGTNQSLLSVAVDRKAQVGTFSLSYSDAGLFGVYVQAQDATTTKEAVKACVQSFKDVAAGKGEKSIQRAIQQAKMSLACDFETSSRQDKINAYGNQLAAGGKLVSVKDMFTKLDAVTAASVASFASKLLKSAPSVSSVGDAFAVPHVDELGL